MMDGSRFDRLQMTPFNLEEPAEMAAFLEPTEGRVHVPGTDRWVNYDIGRRTGIALSKLGASRSIAMGAYLFALNELDK